MTEIINALIEFRPLLFAIIVTLIGIIGTIEIYRRNALSSASIDFINSFKNEIAVFKSPIPLKTGTAYDILIASFEKHQSAVVVFERFLPFYSKSSFRKTWDKYRKNEENPNTRFPEYEKLNHLTAYLTINDEQEKVAVSLALNRINKLLAYAKVR